MNKKSSILTDKEVQGYLDSLSEMDEAHNYVHINRVRAAAKEIAERKGYKQKDLVDIAALMHDMGLPQGREEHQIHGERMVLNDKLLKSRLSEKKIKAIANAVRSHRSSDFKSPPKSMLAKIVSDADRTDMSLGRAYKYGLKHYPKMSQDELLMRGAAKLNEKYGPEGYGRKAVIFPETMDIVVRQNDPITAAWKKKDMKKLRELAGLSKGQGMNKQSFLEEVYNSAFDLELEKVARAAAAKAFLRGDLSLKGLKRASKTMDRTITVKHLGQGAYQHADVVAHPKFGRVVRKIPIKDGGVDKQKINTGVSRKPAIKPNKAMVKKRDEEYQALSHLKDLSKGKKGVNIAQIKGREGVVHYQQYVKPTKMDKAIKKKVYSKTPMSPKEQESFFDPTGKLDNKATVDVFNRFGKRYPGHGDFHRLNIVGNKVVDFEPGDAVSSFSLNRSIMPTKPSGRRK